MVRLLGVFFVVIIGMMPGSKRSVNANRVTQEPQKTCILRQKKVGFGPKVKIILESVVSQVLSGS